MVEMVSYKKEQNCEVTLTSTFPKICHVFALPGSCRDAWSFVGL